MAYMGGAVTSENYGKSTHDWQKTLFMAGSV